MITHFVEQLLVCLVFFISYSQNDKEYCIKFVPLVLGNMLLSVYYQRNIAHKRWSSRSTLKFRSVRGDNFVYVATTLPSLTFILLKDGASYKHLLLQILFSGILFLTVFAVYLTFSTTLFLPMLTLIMAYLLVNTEILQWNSVLYGICVLVVFFTVVRVSPNTFTFTEASLLAQTICLVFVKYALDFQDVYFVTSSISDSTESTFVVILFTCTLVTLVTLSPLLFHFINFGYSPGNKNFLSVLFYGGVIVNVMFVFFPLCLRFLKTTPLSWLLWTSLRDSGRIYLLLYWSLLVFFSLMVVYWYVTFETNISKTIIRKIFHVVGVLIYLPACFDFQFMSLVSSIMFVISVGLEIVRVCRIPPFGDLLNYYLKRFRDKQDVGPLLLTHIYLLLGLSFPFWLPNHRTANSSLSVLSKYSGVISLGIGDTFAAILGKCYGRKRWPGKEKTYFGTISCFMSQFLFMCLIVCVQSALNLRITLALASISLYIALLESTCTQVDNIILPIYTYICFGVVVTFSK